MRTLAPLAVFAATISVGCDAPTRATPPDARLAPDATVPPLPDSATNERAPILFVHGINGSSADFDALKVHLEAVGWPEGMLFSHTFVDTGATGCNPVNAAAIGRWIDTILSSNGVTKVNIIAHSMGSLSARYFLKQLGGTSKVERFISLGGMHKGLASACLSANIPNPPCAWTELCETGSFISELNAADATPGDLHWISIAGGRDETVPSASSILDGAENITIPNVTHAGLLEDPATFAEVARVLAYPAP